MEALAKIRIPGEARQVLDFILRKTYGWHKKEDHISLTQFENATGLKRSNVCASLNRLIKMNLIYKGSMEKETTSMELHATNVQIYGFQKDFDKWVVVLKKIPSPQKETIGSMERDNRIVPKKIHTKDITTKAKYKDKILSNPQIKTFLDFYFEEFKNHFGTPPLIQGGKDGKITQRLLRIIPVDDLKYLLSIFFQSSDKFIKQSGYTLGVFESQINKLRINNKQTGLRAWAKEIIEEEKDDRTGSQGISNSNGITR